MTNEMTGKLINQAKEDIKAVCDGGTVAVLNNLIDTSDYDELGFIIHTLEQAMTARLIEDGENPDVDDTEVHYSSPNFGQHRIRAVTITKAYWDWVRQVVAFINNECDKTLITPRAKRMHVLNTLIVAGLTLYKDVVVLPDDMSVKYQILNKTGMFLPILMMYSFEHKLSFKPSNIIKEVKI